MGNRVPVTKIPSPTLSEQEERHRVLPVIRDLKGRRPDAVVIVDTNKLSVAQAAVEAGAWQTVWDERTLLSGG
jgi:dihydropteroate synthase